MRPPRGAIRQAAVRLTRLLAEGPTPIPAPLASLRMEPGADQPVLWRIEPGFPEQVIATCGFHTPAVRWRL